jgi:CubicO group peptidase (beta-lactamase class C family)
MRISKAVGTVCLIAAFGLGFAGGAGAQSLPRVRPEEAGMSSAQLAHLDVLMNEALARDAFPGAVLLVGRRGRVVYEKTFGLSQLLPGPRPMEAGMIFDLASVTKPVATATSVMLLVERGRVRLWDKVKTYVPEFAPFLELGGAPGEDARLFHLLTHTSGLPPYTDAGEAAAKHGTPCPTEILVRQIAGLRKESRAGETFNYSCLNFITLAWIVEKVSGKNLAEFAAENIFRPLKMDRTFFCPPEDKLELCVPTQVVAGEYLRGIVHDPLARLQGGISGNAGLFSTADDLAVFCQMMLGRGEFRGVRILSPLSVARMTEVYWKTPEAGRGFGWDLRLRDRAGRSLRPPVLRPFRVHRNVALDRPGDGNLRHPADESGASRRHGGRHHRPQEQGGEYRGRRDIEVAPPRPALTSRPGRVK